MLGSKYHCVVSLAELPRLTDSLVACVVPPLVLLLRGNLGAGKTTFVQSLGKSLAIREQISSPTFTLIDEYYSGKFPLYHIDLYRLEPIAIPALHLELYWQDQQEFPPGIVAIEWGEKLPQLPLQFMTVTFHLTQQEDTRLLTWSAQGGEAIRVLTCLATLANLTPSSPP